MHHEDLCNVYIDSYSSDLKCAIAAAGLEDLPHIMKINATSSPEEQEVPTSPAYSTRRTRWPGPFGKARSLYQPATTKFPIMSLVIASNL
jgi:hypothetical protein